MKRIHLIELEDENWFPTTLRDFITDIMKWGAVKIQTYASVAPLLNRVMEHMNTDRIIDLCSGASGPWGQLLQSSTRNQFTASVTLTDKHPNIPAFEQMAAESNGKIEYIEGSIDATDIPPHLKGVRTLFSSFHHFKPPFAKAILQNAVDQKDAICVFEQTERTFKRLLASVTISPIFVLMNTRYFRPVSLLRNVLTYIVPIIPLLAAWDGFVSNLRTYSLEELEEMVSCLEGEKYIWETGRLIPTKEKIKRDVLYLLGYPEHPG